MHIETKTVTDVIPSFSTAGKSFAVDQPTKNNIFIVGAGGDNILLIKPTNDHVMVPLTQMMFAEKVQDDTALLLAYRQLGLWVAERVAVLEDQALTENKDFKGTITVWMHKVEWDRSTLSLTAYIGLSCI